MRKFLVICLAILLFCGCKKQVYYAQVNQPLENIVSIELLDSQDDNELIVLYTLQETEHQTFLNEFMSFHFQANGTPPSTSYGPLAVQIHYKDGYSDIIGLNSNWYLDASGNKVGGHYWYSLIDVDDYYTLFAQYVDVTVLPRPNSPRYTK